MLKITALWGLEIGVGGFYSTFIFCSTPWGWI